MPRAYLAVVACAFAPAFARAGDAPAHRATGDLTIQARDILRRYCAECHTGGADPGRSKLELLDYAQVIAKTRPIPAVTPGGRSQVLEFVKDGSMPPANRPAPTPAEVAVLEKWVQAQAPAYPRAFDERYVLETVADDLDRENAKAKSRGAGQYLRYASFAHLVADGQPVPNLAEAEQRLRSALLAASGKLYAPTPVDAAATVFRLDLRELGWANQSLFEKVEGLRAVGVFPLQPYDLVLLDYPHAAAVPASDALANRLKPVLDSRSQVRPVPFVRGDWLAVALSAPKQYRSSLALDLHSLTELDQAGKHKPDGPAVPRRFGGVPATVARRADGREPLPPLSGWYVGDVTPDPAPFALSAELVSGGESVKAVKVDQSFKLKVTSDRRVFVTLLMIQADGEVRIQQIDGGNVIQANAPRELAPRPTGFNISGIITGGDSATEYFVVLASVVDAPLPTVVRSLHFDRPVWRFLLEPPGGSAFEQNKVVRKVIPIPVSKK